MAMITMLMPEQRLAPAEPILVRSPNDWLDSVVVNVLFMGMTGFLSVFMLVHLGPLNQ